MTRKLLILVGAPTSNSLDWDAGGLLDHFLEPVAQFAGLDSTPSTATSVDGNDTDPESSAWRFLPAERVRLPTGFSQAHGLSGEYRGHPGSFSSLSASSQKTTATSEHFPSQELLAEFYDHSLAIHDDIPSSQLLVEESSSAGSESVVTDESTSFAASMSVTTSPVRTLGLGNSHLSDLRDLPDASYVRSIAPQTMTVNLIVGIISIAEPRAVKTKWGATKSVVELVLGDETKSGFTVTFWLSDGGEGGRRPAEDVLRSLRRQDLVLLRNVALAEFRRKVHGHSLRKDLTKVALLYRRKLDASDVGGLYSAKDLASTSSAHPQLLKTRRVREWVLNFVGGGQHLGKRKEKGRAVRSWELPPPDTQ